MDEREFKARTKKVALGVIEIVETLPKGRTADVLGKQLLRSATSVGANYRAACRSKSTADMINKLAIVEEEADESIYWMELLVESKMASVAQLEPMMSEMDQICAMIVASIKTLRSRR